MSFSNPIIPGFHPDPSICRVGEDFYLVTSSFEYFPGVPLFHSRDLVHWRQLGHCLTRPSQLPLEKCRASGGIYAPTIRYHDGIFYMVTTNVTGGGHFYVWTRDPAGEWSEPVWVAGRGIDPSLFFDADGTVYFTYTDGSQILQGTLNIATGDILEAVRPLWRGTGGAHPEGPHLYKIGGIYYLLISEGGTEYGHMLTIARSASPWGPFEACPRNPILSHRSLSHPIQATGHGDLVQAPDGSWWVALLGIRPVYYPPAYHLGRETFLAPVTWDAGGWPVIGNNGRVELEMDAPDLPAHPWQPVPNRDDFDQDKLSPAWNYLRNPHPTDYALSERPGWLRLTCGPVSLETADSPAWVGQRQDRFACRAAALVDFQPGGEHEEAGLTAWMNENHHYEVFLTRRDGQRAAVVRRKIGSLQAEVARAVVPEGPLTLAIQAEPKAYTFSVIPADGKPQVLPQGETRYLATEVAGGFTGVYFGLYATANGRQNGSRAWFDWFEIV